MYLLAGDKLNTRTLLVVSECLKDRAFHIRTVTVNSLDPNGIVWRLGKPQFRFETFVFSPLSAHCLTKEGHGGKLTFGNNLCTFNEEECIFVCFVMINQEGLRSWRGGDHDDNDEIRTTPTTGTRCPTLLHCTPAKYTDRLR